MPRISALSSLLLLLLLPSPSFADSPLTSTDIGLYYTDNDHVLAAAEVGMTESVLYALLDTSTSYEDALAIINAIGWSLGDEGNPQVFIKATAEAKGLSLSQMEVDSLTARENFIIGYMLAMEHYLDLRTLDIEGPLGGQSPLDFLSRAHAQAPESYSVAMAYALVQAQAELGSDWCKVYRLIHSTDTAYESYDLRPEARQAILDYIASYKSACAEPKPVAGP